MSSAESGNLSSEIHFPPGSFHDRFSFSSESRPPTPVNVSAPINPIFEKRTRRKVDRRLIPVLAVLYAIAFIDATNLVVARREGVDKDFDLLIGHRYYFVSFVFFIPSILHVGTALWLGTMMFLLGALQIASGFVNGWVPFLAVRLVLGILEAGILPSCIYIISSWYKRSEMQVRITLFYAASVFFGSFGNILALGLSKIHSQSMHGWRWIFAIEGLITVLLSFYGYSGVLPLPDRKHTSHAPFLSHDEIQLMRQGIEMDRKDYIPDHLEGAKIFEYLVDVNLWAYAVLAMCANLVVYSSPFLLQASIPDTERDVEIQSLSIPIGVVATAVVLLTGFISSRVGILCPFLIFSFLLSTAGLGMIGFSSHRAVRFAGCFFAYSGAQASIPMILSLQALNVRRHSKRLFTFSFVASFGGIGALLSVLQFPVSGAPNFATGLRTAFALQSAGTVIAGLLMAWLQRRNKVVGELQPTEEGPYRFGGDGGQTQNHDDLRVRTTEDLQTNSQRQMRLIEGIPGFEYST